MIRLVDISNKEFIISVLCFLLVSVVVFCRAAGFIDGGVTPELIIGAMFTNCVTLINLLCPLFTKPVTVFNLVVLTDVCFRGFFCFFWFLLLFSAGRPISLTGGLTRTYYWCDVHKVCNCRQVMVSDVYKVCNCRQFMVSDVYKVCNCRQFISPGGRFY